jgi:ATP synthase mitochondrial F1 complex assembly factor 1
MATAKSKTEVIAEDLEKQNPFYAKYADKIAKLQKTSPEELLKRLETVQDKPKTAKPVAQPTAEAERYTQCPHNFV